MQIISAIIHKVRKQPGHPPVFTGSHQCLDPNVEINRSLIRDLDKSFRRKSKYTHGIFDVNPHTTFQREFTAYQNSRTQAQFIRFTKRASINLKQLIASVNTSGGYLVFAHYLKQGIEFVGVFLVRDTNGLAIRRGNEGADYYAPKKRIHLDLEKIAMVCLINLSELANGARNYIAFTANKRESVSSYFLNWIAITNQITNEEDTNGLLDLLKVLPLPDAMAARPADFIESVANHIRDNDFNVDLKNISEIFYGNESFLSEQCEERGIAISTNFKANKSALKHWVKISVETTDIQLTFSRSAWEQQNISLSAENENLVIIESPELAQQLRQEFNLDNIGNA